MNLKGYNMKYYPSLHPPNYTLITYYVGTNTLKHSKLHYVMRWRPMLFMCDTTHPNS